MLDKPSNSSKSLDIVACHGKSSGKLLGSKVNNVRDLILIYPGADIYLMGHDHSRGGMPAVSLEAIKSKNKDKLHIKERTQFYCRTGSYLQAYKQDRSSYASSRLLAPSSLGKITLRVKMKRCYSGGMDYLDNEIKLET